MSATSMRKTTPTIVGELQADRNYAVRPTERCKHVGRTSLYMSATTMHKTTPATVGKHMADINYDVRPTA